METEKPHRTGTGVTTSDFFLCFSSRSSIKMSTSKSFPSPGRNRGGGGGEATVSLSSSLSRRLRSNGSMKGGQASPMFPTGSKKKGNGASFEPPEPTSPKVTCIGQVRVKTKKKHGRKMRTRSKRRSGEVSFRKAEDGECLKGRNQRWVHLPLTICDALRGLGACGGRGSCSWGRVDKRKTTSSSTSRGAVFARWLFAMEREEKREMEIVIEKEEIVEKKREIEVDMLDERQVNEEIEFEAQVDDEQEEEEQDEARVSICIPPKNALLLMRCRSEPFRTSSLANRFWDSPAPKDNEEEEDDEAQEYNVEQVVAQVAIEENEIQEENFLQVQENKEEEEEEPEKWDLAEDGKIQNILQVYEASIEENPEEIDQECLEKEQEEIHEPQVEEEEIIVNGSEGLGNEEDELETTIPEMEEAEEEEKVRFSSSSSALSVQPEEGGGETVQDVLTAAEEEQPEGADLVEESTEETERVEEEEEKASVSVSDTKEEVKQINGQDEERENENVLPDCLLLMMCEPKLSMEVSKETWVCSTDFIRHRPHHPEKKSNGGGGGGGDETKKRLSTDSKPPPRPQPARQQQPSPPPKKQKQKQKQPKLQPARSSCSAVVGTSMVSMIEQKLVNAAAYEPFVLTRCKSEPVRSSSKLAPEACFWKSRKVEPHRTPGLGVGAAAGIGA